MKSSSSKMSKAEAATRHLASGGFVCEHLDNRGNCLLPAKNYKRNEKEQKDWPSGVPISLCEKHSKGRTPLKDVINIRPYHHDRS